MYELTLRSLTPADAEALSSALLASPTEYMRFFRPFDFGAASLRQRLEAAKDDRYFGIEVTAMDRREFAGFYMLRGMDEGYPNPMYGVYTAYAYRGLGVARLTLAHADTYCRLKKYERILLKVHPNNFRAKALYESFGFVSLRDDPASGEVVLVKDLLELDAGPHSAAVRVGAGMV